MKINNTLLAIGYAALVLVIACTQAEQKQAVGTAAETASKAVLLNDPDSISRDSAVKQEARWQVSKGQMVTALGQNDPNSKYLVNGFRVPAADLRGILANYAAGDSIYAMLAIHKNTTDGKMETALVFETTNPQTGKKVYYDFSRPCPPGCPKN